MPVILHDSGHTTRSSGHHAPAPRKTFSQGLSQTVYNAKVGSRVQPILASHRRHGLFAQNRVDTSQLTQVCAYEPIPSSQTDICIRKFGGNAQNVAPRVNSLNSLETLAPSA